MKVTEQYRQRAEDALKMARSAPDDDARREWLDIASEWTALAKTRMDLVLSPPANGNRHPKQKRDG